MTTELLFKYFRGEASEKEKEEICLWLETSPSAEKEYRHAQFLFEGIVLYGDINLKKSRRKTPVIKAIKRVFAVAAVVSIVLAGGFILRNSIINIISRNYVAVRTLPGQKTTVELSDGTLVSLNSGTVLEYPPVFWGKRRTVKLSGEALFDVKPDIDRPFVVSTFASDIEVLGTRFNVAASEEKTLFSTTLLEGKVCLKDKIGGRSKILMKPMENVYLARNHFEKRRINNLKSICWLEGLVNIEAESFFDLLCRLENAYGVKFIIKTKDMPSIEGLSGEIRISDGISHAMEVLKRVVPFEYEHDQDSDTILIK